MEENKERIAGHLVTSENIEQFRMEKMGRTQETQQNTEEITQNQTDNGEQKAGENSISQPENEQTDDQIPEDGTIEGNKVVFRGKWVPKSDYGYRMHLKTEEVKKERARTAELERRVKELEAGSQKSGEKSEDSEPQPADFTDAFEYARKLAEWSAKQAIKQREQEDKERAQKSEQDRLASEWQNRVAKAAEKHDDFEDLLNSTPIQFSSQVQYALMESEHGAELLYHYLQNPADADKLGKMTVTAALRELGKIEAKFMEKPTKAATRNDLPPAPIIPIKGGNTPMAKVNEKGEFTGSFAEYKAARKAGQLK